MPRRPRNKGVQKNSESESDDDDVYQEDREESTTQSQSPSPAPVSASLSPLPETPPPRRVTRSSTPKVREEVAITLKTPKTPKTLKPPKTPKTPRAIVARALVVKKATAAAQQALSDIDIQSVDDTESETVPQLLKTPTTKKPRPRAKKGAAAGRKEARLEGGEVEPKEDVKSVKKPALKKPEARDKGQGAEDQSEEEEIDAEADAKLVKTLTPMRSRTKPEGSGAASERAMTLATPKKPRATRPKKTVKASASAAPVIASIQDNDDGDGSFVGLPRKVSSLSDSPMDGIETYKFAATVLQTSNTDCEITAMPQQERNGGGRPYCHGYDTVSLSPTVRPETPTRDNTGSTGQGTTRGAHARSMISSILKEEPRSRAGPTVPEDRHQIRSLILDDKSLFSLPVKTEPQVPELLGSRSIISATTTPSAAYLLTPLATIDDVAKTVDRTYGEASRYLLGALNLTRRALEDHAHAIQFHTVAFQVFGQGQLMTESQCQTLFPQEQFADLATRSVLFPSSPLQSPSASAATPPPVTLAPQTQANTSAQDKHLLINVIRNMKRELETALTNVSLQKSSNGSDSHKAQFPDSPLDVELGLRQRFGPTVGICTRPTRLPHHYTATAVINFIGSGMGCRRDESTTQSGTHGQQSDLTPSQQQERRLAMFTLAGSRVQPEYCIQQQYNQQHNREVEMEQLKTTTVVEEARINDEGPGLTRVQLTSSQWSRIQERSTDLYLKAVKSYEDSRRADRIASESHDQFMDASKRWYALTGHAFPYD
ncbi:hypothetical protein BGZ89_003376 [Linnemannia elongata]|nr:hypothetical protein BGZ89_003376 [Linnemannia elongata]